MKQLPVIGIIGAGRLGTALARQLTAAGYNVHIANSREPESQTLILSVLVPNAIAGTVTDVAAVADIAILALPLNQYTTLDRHLFDGTTVIDAMNYWPATEGSIADFEDAVMSSSEVIQNYFADAYVIKTLNHTAYNELAEHSLPSGDPNRRVIAFAGNSMAAKMQAAKLIDAIGFDPVDYGDLPNGKKFQPDTILFNARYTKQTLPAQSAAIASRHEIQQFADKLTRGEVGVIATDTVYGVVCKLDNQTAVERIYAAKQRDTTKPVGTILIANIDQLRSIATIDVPKFAQFFWPGPVSIIMPVVSQLAYAHKNLGSLPFRIPNDARLRELLALTGPLATSSANLQGEEPATTISEAQNYFGSTVDFYWNGGELINRSASKIIEFKENGTLTIIRD